MYKIVSVSGNFLEDLKRMPQTFIESPCEILSSNYFQLYEKKDAQLLTFDICLERDVENNEDKKKNCRIFTYLKIT